MRESYEEALQRISNQRAANLMEAHEQIRNLKEQLSAITAERDDLRFKLANECQHSKIFAEAYAVWKLRAESAEAERNALKARIEEAEKQEAAAHCNGDDLMSVQGCIYGKYVRLVNNKSSWYATALYAAPIPSPDTQELISKAVEEEREALLWHFNQLDHYMNNPSAWDHYDDGVSFKIGAVLEAIRSRSTKEK